MASVATKVEPRIVRKTPGQQPYGLQATDDGLWVIDEIDPNDLFKRKPVRPDGAGSGNHLRLDGNFVLAGVKLRCRAAATIH
jgi:hypothetical protein